MRLIIFIISIYTLLSLTHTHVSSSSYKLLATRLIIFIISIYMILFVYCFIIIRWDEDLLHLLATSVDHEAQTRAHEQENKRKKRSNPCRVPGCALTGIECVL